MEYDEHIGKLPFERVSNSNATDDGVFNGELVWYGGLLIMKKAMIHRSKKMREHLACSDRSCKCGHDQF